MLNPTLSIYQYLSVYQMSYVFDSQLVPMQVSSKTVCLTQVLQQLTVRVNKHNFVPTVNSKMSMLVNNA